MLLLLQALLTEGYVMQPLPQVAGDHGNLQVR
jgi:hypothetical protein